jgi:hypothetical protein
MFAALSLITSRVPAQQGIADASARRSRVPIAPIELAESRVSVS